MDNMNSCVHYTCICVYDFACCVYVWIYWFTNPTEWIMRLCVHKLTVWHAPVCSPLPWCSPLEKWQDLFLCIRDLSSDLNGIKWYSEHQYCNLTGERASLFTSNQRIQQYNDITFFKTWWSRRNLEMKWVFWFYLWRWRSHCGQRGTAGSSATINTNMAAPSWVVRELQISFDATFHEIMYMTIYQAEYFLSACIWYFFLSYLLLLTQPNNHHFMWLSYCKSQYQHVQSYSKFRNVKVPSVPGCIKYFKRLMWLIIVLPTLTPFSVA